MPFVLDQDPMEPKIQTGSYVVAMRLIEALDEKREIVRFGRHADTNFSNCRGSVLVFLPGLGEIEMMSKILRVNLEYDSFGSVFCMFLFIFTVSDSLLVI